MPERTCSLAGCARRLCARGLCNTHYVAAKRKGALPPLQTAADRFWDHVDRGGPGECWVWLGPCVSGGYGKTRMKGRYLSAHRAAWELERGPIPDGLFVLHRCDNRPCVNPAHLFLGTGSDNMRDCSAKGRIIRGTAHHLAKLDDRVVRELRVAYDAGTLNLSSAADSLNVDFSTLWAAMTRKTWKHVH